jgi:hypothetical protein
MMKSNHKKEKDYPKYTKLSDKNIDRIVKEEFIDKNI